MMVAVWDEPDEAEAADDVDDEPMPVRRRAGTIWLAALVAVSLLAVPLWNVFEPAPVADNGLEICGFDYCGVFEAVRDAGREPALLRLSNTFLDEESAVGLAEDLVAGLGEPPVTVEVVDHLPASTAGRYTPSRRLIELQRPVRAWTVVHEAAHTVAPGHDADFQETLLGLVDTLEGTDLTPR